MSDASTGLDLDASNEALHRTSWDWESLGEAISWGVRLLAEVERLRDGIRHHEQSVRDHARGMQLPQFDPTAYDLDLWALLDDWEESP